MESLVKTYLNMGKSLEEIYLILINSGINSLEAHNLIINEMPLQETKNQSKKVIKRNKKQGNMQDTIVYMKKQGFILCFFDNYANEVNPNVAIKMQVSKFGEGLHKVFRLPKNKNIVTVQWVMKKITDEKVYKNLSDLFCKIIEGKNNHNIYPTSYGIGFFSGFGKDNETVDKLSKLLNDYNITFRNEYSEAGWTYRFVISKSASNINNINELISDLQNS